MHGVEADRIAEVALSYYELRKRMTLLDSTTYDGPNATSAQVAAARELIDVVLPRFKQQASPEVQRRLGVDANQIERVCKAYLPSANAR